MKYRDRLAMFMEKFKIFKYVLGKKKSITWQPLGVEVTNEALQGAAAEHEDISTVNEQIGSTLKSLADKCDSLHALGVYLQKMRVKPHLIKGDRLLLQLLLNPLMSVVHPGGYPAGTVHFDDLANTHVQNLDDLTL